MIPFIAPVVSECRAANCSLGGGTPRPLGRITCSYRRFPPVRCNFVAWAGAQVQRRYHAEIGGECQCDDLTVYLEERGKKLQQKPDDIAEQYRQCHPSSSPDSPSSAQQRRREQHDEGNGYRGELQEVFIAVHGSVLRR